MDHAIDHGPRRRVSQEPHARQSPIVQALLNVLNECAEFVVSKLSTLKIFEISFFFDGYYRIWIMDI